MTRDLAIFDDNGPVFIGSDNPDTMTAYAYLKNPEQTIKNVPEDHRAAFIQRYSKVTTGKVYLVRVMDTHENS